METNLLVLRILMTQTELSIKIKCRFRVKSFSSSSSKDRLIIMVALCKINPPTSEFLEVEEWEEISALGKMIPSTILLVNLLEVKTIPTTHQHLNLVVSLASSLDKIGIEAQIL